MLYEIIARILIQPYKFQFLRSQYPACQCPRCRYQKLPMFQSCQFQKLMHQKLKNLLVIHVVVRNLEKCSSVMAVGVDVAVVLVVVTLNHANVNHHSPVLSTCKLIEPKACQIGLFSNIASNLNILS